MIALVVVVVVGMDIMPRNGGEKIIKTLLLQRVVPRWCFKKKITGRYPPSLPGQRRRRCQLLVVTLLIRVSSCRHTIAFFFYFNQSHLFIHPLSLLFLPANKRNRTTSPQHSFGFNHYHHNSTTTHHQQQKIQELEQENENLRSQNQKVENENRILKRAVTIQQDRQHQLNEELEGARRFKEQAEERIRRLEQMNVTLQYQLQAQSSSAGNDFMGFSPRPPDVY